MGTLALSRTCNLRDFPGCVTVAGWQQCLADRAWAEWTVAQHLRIREGGVVVNYSGIDFRAPGPTATYYGREPRRPWGVASPNGRTPVPTVYDGARVPAVYALCVLDRIETPVAFLSQAAAILRPHGLLVLTFAYWDAEGEDTAAGCEERLRIYSAHSYQRLIRDGKKVGFETFGGTDWRYHGDFLDDHSLASLVLTRRQEA